MVEAIRLGYKDVTRRKATKARSGDILYVRENFCVDGTLFGLSKSGVCLYATRQAYAYNESTFRYDIPLDTTGFDWEKVKWTPCIHMPKTCSRFFLKVNSVSIENITMISQRECLREGVYYDESIGLFSIPLIDINGEDPLSTFKKLWVKINAEWRDKPVYRIHFDVLFPTGYEKWFDPFKYIQ